MASTGWWLLCSSSPAPARGPLGPPFQLHLVTDQMSSLLLPGTWADTPDSGFAKSVELFLCDSQGYLCLDGLCYIKNIQDHWRCLKIRIWPHWIHPHPHANCWLALRSAVPCGWGVHSPHRAHTPSGPHPSCLWVCKRPGKLWPPKGPQMLLGMPVGREWPCLCVYCGRRTESERTERQQDPGVTADNGRNGVSYTRDSPGAFPCGHSWALQPREPGLSCSSHVEKPEVQAGGVTCPSPNTQLCSLRPRASAPGPGRVSASS